MSVKGYENEIYALQTRHTSYIIRVGEDRIPENVYWGKRIDRIEDFAGEASPAPVNMQAPHCLREECASFGGMRFKESSMKVCFARSQGLPRRKSICGNRGKPSGAGS